MSPLHDESPRDASSSTAADKAISTLRARLCSEDPIPAFHGPSSAESYPNHNDIYRQLRSAFSATTGPGIPCTSDTGRAIMDKLAETFARSGEETYKSAMSQLKNVHEVISNQINAFHSESVSTLSDTAALYGNITYPLSATKCHSRQFPKGTIQKHLSSLQATISTAEEELQSLNKEWISCAEQEADILEVPAGNDDSSVKENMEALISEIDGIVRDKTADIEQMDKEYRDLMWKESHKMMQAMMAD